MQGELSISESCAGLPVNLVNQSAPKCYSGTGIYESTLLKKTKCATPDTGSGIQLKLNTNSVHRLGCSPRVECCTTHLRPYVSPHHLLF